MALPLGALAEELRPTYNEVSAGFGRASGGAEFWYAAGQMELGQNWAVKLAHGRLKHEGFNQVQNAPQIAGIFHTPINEQLDFVARANYARFRSEWHGGRIKESRNGYSLNAGVKYRASPAFQLQGMVGYSLYGKDRDGNSYRTPRAELDVNYDFAQNFGMHAGVVLSKGGAWQ